MKKKLLTTLSLVFLLLIFFSSQARAYVLNVNKLPFPQRVVYWVDPQFGQMLQSTNVVSGVMKMNAAPEVHISRQTTTRAEGHVRIHYEDKYNGSIVGSSWGLGHIVIYKLWTEKNGTEKRETILHEVGHEAGLAHTQKVNDKISVMREYGFNQKDYLLRDDFNGLAAKY